MKQNLINRVGGILNFFTYTFMIGNFSYSNALYRCTKMVEL